MARVTWAPRAVADLRAVQDYIAANSRQAAGAQVQRIRRAARRLATFPESGRAVPERRGQDLREVIVRPFRVIYVYRREVDRARILAVIHGSRELPAIDDDA